MSKIEVLVNMAEDSGEAKHFSSAVEGDLQLRESVELRFANREQFIEKIRDAQVAVCGNISSEALTAANNLRWIAFWSAGLDGKITPEMTNRHLLITNGSGIHGPNIAEHVFAWMLMFTREMPFYFRQQMESKYGSGNRGQWGVHSSELSGQTLGIVGLGRIGEALTQRAKAFEMRVIATKRDPSARYESAIQPDAIYAAEELPRLLSESDHVCICLPHTPETEHLFNAETIAQMKPSAYLYNIGRGKIVDENALAVALQNKKIAGAGLDVFETEPLPPDSPLWQMENVLITPHVAGGTPHYFSRFAKIFAANLKRYLNREPLQNLYDPARHY